jgi:hypothetical protein
VKITSVPNIATRRLRVKVEAGIHPDSNALAAFVERSLNQHEQADIFEHLAHCMECREVVALALPPQIDTAASSTAVSSSGWLSWPVLRWGAVGACVVVVGAAVTLHHESMQTSRPAIMAPASDARVVQSKAPATAPGESANTAVQLTKQSPVSNVRLPAAGAVSVAAPAQQNLEIPGRAKDESELSSAGPLKMPLSGSVPTRQMMGSSAMIARAATIPANVIPRWTLTSDGMLQRSIDSGRTWETILVASPGTFRALTANSFDIWVGGAKGALYHSIDAGQHWMKVQPVADGLSLNTDIIGIEFPDLTHGTLTTADKHTWITADAGQTWIRQ